MFNNLKERVKLLERKRTISLIDVKYLKSDIKSLERQAEINRENIMLIMNYFGVHLEEGKRVVEDDDMETE